MKPQKMSNQKGSKISNSNIEANGHESSTPSVTYIRYEEKQPSCCQFNECGAKKIVKWCLNPVLILTIALFTFLLLVIIGHATGWIY
uniref:Uncharacterized protein n=1 Tax=Parascaris univalens TaxID=6257 RepID=A0A914ZM10_PARUN